MQNKQKLAQRLLFIQDAYCMASLDNITGSDYSWSGSVGSFSFNALDRLITPLPV